MYVLQLIMDIQKKNGCILHQEGSLRGYYEHKLIRNPLAYPGEMDLTTHIHWDELKEMFSLQGMNMVWHKKQSEFC